MDRALPRPLDWRMLAVLPLALLAAYSVLHIAALLPIIVSQPVPADWGQHRIAAELLVAGESPYFLEDWYRFRWSPVAGWLMVPLTALGPWAWMAAQFGVLLTLPRKLALVVLLAFPFWADVQAGNILTFAFVAGWHALQSTHARSIALRSDGTPSRVRGVSRDGPVAGRAFWPRPLGAFLARHWATAAFLVMAVLVPRPLLIPLALYLLWKQPKWRVPFAVLLLASLIGAVVTGWHVEWAEMLLLTGSEEAHRLGAQILPGWPFTGVLLAGVLVWAGFPGLAGFALSPYWLTYYWLFVLLTRRTPSTD